MLKPMPMTDLLVLWRVFEPCNLGCRFCGYSKDLPRPRAVANVPEVLRFGSVLAEHARQTGRRITVSWLGGEPLLWPALPELASEFHRNGLRLSITSNGLPLEDRRVRASLIDHYDRITVSVDGLADFHDECRGMPGLFERVKRAVCALRAESNSLTIAVNTILMRGNIANFESLCEEVAGWGVTELTFNQLGGNDRPEFYPANRLLPEQVSAFAAALPGIRSRLPKLRIQGSDEYLNRIAFTSRGVAILIGDCEPGQSFLFIDERGRIAPCSFTAPEYGIPMESIRTAEDFAWLPERFAEQRKHRSAACDDCHSTQVFGKFLRQMELPIIV